MDVKNNKANFLYIFLFPDICLTLSFTSVLYVCVMFFMGPIDISYSVCQLKRIVNLEFPQNVINSTLTQRQKYNRLCIQTKS